MQSWFFSLLEMSYLCWGKRIKKLIYSYFAWTSLYILLWKNIYWVASLFFAADWVMMCSDFWYFNSIRFVLSILEFKCCPADAEDAGRKDWLKNMRGFCSQYLHTMFHCVSSDEHWTGREIWNRVILPHYMSSTKLWLQFAFQTSKRRRGFFWMLQL